MKRELEPSWSLLARAGQVSNYLHDHVTEGARLEADAAEREARILQIVERKFGA